MDPAGNIRTRKTASTYGRKDGSTVRLVIPQAICLSTFQHQQSFLESILMYFKLSKHHMTLVGTST